MAYQTGGDFPLLPAFSTDSKHWTVEAGVPIAALTVTLHCGGWRPHTAGLGCLKQAVQVLGSQEQWRAAVSIGRLQSWAVPWHHAITRVGGARAPCADPWQREHT